MFPIELAFENLMPVFSQVAQIDMLVRFVASVSRTDLEDCMAVKRSCKIESPANIYYKEPPILGFLLGYLHVKSVPEIFAKLKSLHMHAWQSKGKGTSEPRYRRSNGSGKMQE